MGMNVKATDQCRNCGDEFANHDYVPDSITIYKCKTPHQDSGYGYGYRGCDPHKYHPDYECCSEAEIQAWKEACDIVNRGEKYEGDYCWGIGIHVHEYDQFFEPLEHDYEDED